MDDVLETTETSAAVAIPVPVTAPVKKKRGNPELWKYGFRKDDPVSMARINRNGRPRKSDELRRVLLDKLESVALDKNGDPLLRDGQPVTHLELMLEKMLKDPRSFKEILDRAYGKVRDEVEINGTMAHTAASVDLGSLGLDRETQRKILDAMRRNHTDE
jgi:NurA-like 5'-3' nuclease